MSGTRISAIPKGWVTIGALVVPVALANPGHSNETLLQEYIIPAGMMGANGICKVTIGVTGTVSANTKTWRVRFGGLTGDQFMAYSPTTLPTIRTFVLIKNQNNVAAQRGMVSAGLNQSSGWGTSASVTFPTGTQNTAAAVSVAATLDLQDGTETGTLEEFIVEVLSQA